MIPSEQYKYTIVAAMECNKMERGNKRDIQENVPKKCSN